ncbi:pleckstrin homology-like domain family A member 1 [Salvelinus sp. IW2-2015]|uniref:pleckstrin homology-like domain family A member 1 n=1 Tax=Salvelinus sp. IW2-2015 TaxID=2691554 RepID=UPI0038D46184
MSEGKTVTFKDVELEPPELGPETQSSSHLDTTQTSPQPQSQPDPQSNQTPQSQPDPQSNQTPQSQPDPQSNQLPQSNQPHQSPQSQSPQSQSPQSQSPQVPESGHPEVETEERGSAAPTPDTGAGARDGAGPGAKGNRWTSALNQFKLKRFFV